MYSPQLDDNEHILLSLDSVFSYEIREKEMGEVFVTNIALIIHQHENTDLRLIHDSCRSLELRSDSVKSDRLFLNYNGSILKLTSDRADLLASTLSSAIGKTVALPVKKEVKPSSISEIRSIDTQIDWSVKVLNPPSDNDALPPEAELAMPEIIAPFAHLSEEIQDDVEKAFAEESALTMGQVYNLVNRHRVKHVMQKDIDNIVKNLSNAKFMVIGNCKLIVNPNMYSCWENSIMSNVPITTINAAKKMRVNINIAKEFLKSLVKQGKLVSDKSSTGEVYYDNVWENDDNVVKNEII